MTSTHAHYKDSKTARQDYKPKKNSTTILREETSQAPTNLHQREPSSPPLGPDLLISCNMSNLLPKL